MHAYSSMNGGTVGISAPFSGERNLNSVLYSTRLSASADALALAEAALGRLKARDRQKMIRRAKQEERTRIRRIIDRQVQRELAFDKYSVVASELKRLRNDIIAPKGRLSTKTKKSDEYSTLNEEGHWG